MMEKTTLIELLQACCGKTDCRQVFLHPFVSVINGKETIIATDSYIMMVLHSNEESLVTLYKELNKEKQPDINRALQDFDNPVFTTITLENMKKALDKIGIHMDYQEIECPECNGECSVEWSYIDRNRFCHTDYHSCPECGGLGTVKADNKEKIFDKNTVISIGNAYFSPNKIKQAIDVIEKSGCTNLKCVTTKTKILIRTDIFDLIVMGLGLSDEEIDEYTKINCDIFMQ